MMSGASHDSTSRFFFLLITNAPCLLLLLICSQTSMTFIHKVSFKLCNRRKKICMHFMDAWAELKRRKTIRCLSWISMDNWRSCSFFSNLWFSRGTWTNGEKREIRKFKIWDIKYSLAATANSATKHKNLFIFVGGKFFLKRFALFH